MTTVALGLLLVGCGGGPEPPATTGGPEQAALPAAYSFRLTSSCGERALIGSYRVWVVDGEVARVDPIGGTTTVPDLSYVPSIADLEAMIDDAEPDAVVEVDRDAGGLLTWVSIDHVPNGIDDEECYRLSGLRDRTGGAG